MEKTVACSTNNWKPKENKFFHKINCSVCFSLFLILILFKGNFSYGQDSHYWNLQYGTKATLLGGAVIGSVSDLSATYYNPGAISLFENPKLIISAKVYEYERFKVEDGAGVNSDLISDKLTAAPNFFAFKIKIDTTNKNKLAISVLTRQYIDLEFSTRKITTTNNSNNGNSTTSGVFNGHQYLNEMWGGISYSHKVNDVIGIGVTGYGVYRNQSTKIQRIVEELQGNSQINSNVNFKYLNYTNYRALLKTGIAFNVRPFTMGLTITTPSINLFGKGSYGYSKIISDPDSIINNVYATNYQDSIKSLYKSSWAIGVGAAYWADNYSIHVSAEWYNAIKKFHPLSVESFNAQSSGALIQNEINQELTSVLNFGLGVDYKINDNTSVSGGIITDYSANEGNGKSNVSLTKWDIYHLSAGSNFKFGKTEVTLGLAYSFGKDEINQVVDIDNATGVSSIIKPTLNTQFTRIKLLFGFVF